MNRLAMDRRQFVARSGCLLGSTLTERLTPWRAALPQPQQHSAQAARAVLERTLGSRADAFDLQLEPSSEPLPAYAYTAANGRVEIRATSTVALCRGAYAYLREHCHAMITWSGRHLDSPQSFPTLKPTASSAPSSTSSI